MSAFNDPNGAALGCWIFGLLLVALLIAWALSFKFEPRTDRGEWRHLTNVHRAKRSMADDLH